MDVFSFSWIELRTWINFLFQPARIYCRMKCQMLSAGNYTTKKSWVLRIRRDEMRSCISSSTLQVQDNFPSKKSGRLIPGTVDTKLFGEVKRDLISLRSRKSLEPLCFVRHSDFFVSCARLRDDQEFTGLVDSQLATSYYSILHVYYPYIHK